MKDRIKRLALKSLGTMSLIISAIALGAFFALQAMHALVIVGLIVAVAVPFLAVVGLAMAIQKTRPVFVTA